MTAQLPLCRPGYCRICTCVRLSVANTSGVCDGCEADAGRGLNKYVMPPGRRPAITCRNCGGTEQLRGGQCAECKRADARRAYRRRQAQYATVTGAELAPQTLERCA